MATAPTRPPTCEGFIRTACTRQPNWRLREQGDGLEQNWQWVCHRHLSTACADLGEGARIDVIRVGC